MPLGMPGMPPRESCFIIACIWRNCASSWLISAAEVPEPLAMRRLREPPMISGRRRSSASSTG